jgi:hypothetical protein
MAELAERNLVGDLDGSSGLLAVLSVRSPMGFLKLLLEMIDLFAEVFELRLVHSACGGIRLRHEGYPS